jgi:hypothetical protein
MSMSTAALPGIPLAIPVYTDPPPLSSNLPTSVTSTGSTAHIPACLPPKRRRPRRTSPIDSATRPPAHALPSAPRIPCAVRAALAALVLARRFPFFPLLSSPCMHRSCICDEHGLDRSTSAAPRAIVLPPVPSRVPRMHCDRGQRPHRAIPSSSSLTTNGPRTCSLYCTLLCSSFQLHLSCILPYHILSIVA